MLLHLMFFNCFRASSSYFELEAVASLPADAKNYTTSSLRSTGYPTQVRKIVDVTVGSSFKAGFKFWGSQFVCCFFRGGGDSDRLV